MEDCPECGGRQVEADGWIAGVEWECGSWRAAGGNEFNQSKQCATEHINRELLRMGFRHAP